MKTVGQRKQVPITFSASAELLREGARFNDEMHRLPGGGSSLIPKGVRRFKSHEEANRDWLECVARGMAQIARSRR